MGKLIRGEEFYRFVRVLKDGSLKFKIEQSAFGGCGWFVLEVTKGRVKFVRYDTRNSPFHNVTSCPAHTLLLLPVRKSSNWQEQGESNYFLLKANSRIRKGTRSVAVPAGRFRCFAMKVSFAIPKDYTGPHYFKKQYWVAEGVGIVRLDVWYADGRKDKAVLKEFQTGGSGVPFRPGNWWLYDWRCQFGPNKYNIHNTGQEEKYKPPKP